MHDSTGRDFGLRVVAAGGRALATVALGAWASSARAQSGPLQGAMDRAGSGTSWMPDAIALPAWHFMAGGWGLMVHGNAFGQYDWRGTAARPAAPAFWMELGAAYERALTQRFGVALYAAPVGEPALGPVAFMHRPSTIDNPAAPIGHHWQDATHVTFGVLTAGFFTDTWKLEGSVFNGREPDENR